eukprot:363275-Chlamydomonas_euryale.AAC.18
MHFIHPCRDMNLSRKCALCTIIAQRLRRNKAAHSQRRVQSCRASSNQPGIQQKHSLPTPPRRRKPSLPLATATATRAVLHLWLGARLLSDFLRLAVHKLEADVADNGLRTLQVHHAVAHVKVGDLTHEAALRVPAVEPLHRRLEGDKVERVAVQAAERRLDDCVGQHVGAARAHAAHHVVGLHAYAELHAISRVNGVRNALTEPACVKDALHVLWGSRAGAGVGKEEKSDSQLVSKSASQLASQPAGQPASQSPRQSIGQPASQPAGQPATQSARHQTVSQPDSQSGRQSISQPDSQPARQSISQPASRSCSQWSGSARQELAHSYEENDALGWCWRVVGAGASVLLFEASVQIVQEVGCPV